MAAIPAFSTGSAFSELVSRESKSLEEDTKVVFIYDGKEYNPLKFLDKLHEINSISPIQADSYGKGGVVEDLEKKFAEITGKEKAIFMPTGTMANQLAVAALGGKDSKVIVQDISHLNRDEADANLIYGTKLVPLAINKTYFTANELQKKIENLPSEEYFYTGIGAVSIENPVRRAGGEFVPFEELMEIKKFCDSKSIKMHLDGARIYLASAWSGVTVKEYSSLFDTIYISLYKYLGANGGAILCGEAAIIDLMPRLIKVHGGNIRYNWENAAMALYYLDKIESILAEVKKHSDLLLKSLNEIDGVKVESNEYSTNIYSLQLDAKIDAMKAHKRLADEFNLILIPPSPKNQIRLMMNETLLNQDLSKIIQAFRTCLI